MPTPVEILPEDVIKAVEALVVAFAKRNVRYAIFGGIAVAMRSQPRFTRDVDVLIDVPQLVLPGLLDDLVEAGFSLDRTKVIQEYVRDQITKFHFGVVRVDWLKPPLPAYARALSGATSVPWTEGYEVRAVGVESLVVMKLISFRGKDQVDIETLLAANRNTIDLDNIRKQWAEISENEDERTAWLDRAIEQFTKPKG